MSDDGSGERDDGTDQPNHDEEPFSSEVNSTDRGALVLPKLSYNSKTSKEVEIPDQVRNRVDTFVVPPGYVRKGSREQSFIYSWGVNVVPDDSPNPRGTRTNKFFCLATRSCELMKKAVSTKDSKSGVSKHLLTAHNIVGNLSIARKATMDKTDAAVDAIETKSRTFGVGRKRTLELQFARCVIKKFLPMNHAESHEVRVFWRAMAKDAPTISAERTKHLIVELYAATKAKILDGLKEAIAEAPLPIVHFSVDLWTCKVSTDKYIGIHIFWVDGKAEFRHALVSVAPYCPDTTTAGNERAATMLWRIFVAIMKDIGVRPSDLASGTTDSGSDVKSMCVKHAKEHGILWDWCISHMSAKAFEHTFGTSAEPSKSKNLGARDVIRVVIKVMERLNRSSAWRAKFDHIQIEDLGVCVKVLKHAPHRWLSLTKTLERVIRLWHPLKKLFINDGQMFPLEADGKKEQVLELYSLMAPVADIIRDAQHGSLPMNGETHMQMSLLHVTLLAESEPLNVFQIPDLPPEGSRANMSAKLASVPVAHANLTDVGKSTRRLLRNAFVSRFTARVWDGQASDPSFFRDAAVVLVPSFSKSKHLDMLKLQDGDKVGLPASNQRLAPTMSTEVEHKRDELWKEIRRRAIEAAVKVNGALGVVEAESSADAPASKRTRLSGTAGANGDGETASHQWAIFEDEDAEESLPTSAEGQAAKAVDDEIDSFKGMKRTAGSFSPRQALSYWKSAANLRYPKLWRVAQQVYGNQASAAQIERDFGGAGQLLSSRRSRLDCMYVEMLLFLHLNFDQMPQDVPAIRSDALNTFFPKRFTGTNAEFDEAMQFVTGTTGTPPETGSDSA